MATGPEHFRKAEQHLEWAREKPLDSPELAYNLAVAQVHATLALTAATYLGAMYGADPTPDKQDKAWKDAGAIQ